MKLVLIKGIMVLKILAESFQRPKVLVYTAVVCCFGHFEHVKMYGCVHYDTCTCIYINKMVRKHVVKVAIFYHTASNFLILKAHIHSELFIQWMWPRADQYQSALACFDKSHLWQEKWDTKIPFGVKPGGRLVPSYLMWRGLRISH